jgi:hypothetical protein
MYYALANNILAIMCAVVLVLRSTTATTATAASNWLW